MFINASTNNDGFYTLQPNKMYGIKIRKDLPEILLQEKCIIARDSEINRLKFITVKDFKHSLIFIIEYTDGGMIKFMLDNKIYYAGERDRIFNSRIFEIYYL